MPYFKFKCDKCGRELEVLTNWREATLADGHQKCRDCDGVIVKQPTTAAVMIYGYSEKNGYGSK